MLGINIAASAIINPRAISVPRVTTVDLENTVTEIPLVFKILGGHCDGNISTFSNENLIRVISSTFPKIIRRMFDVNSFVHIIGSIMTEEERSAILHVYIKSIEDALERRGERIAVGGDLEESDEE